MSSGSVGQTGSPVEVYAAAVCPGTWNNMQISPPHLYLMCTHLDMLQYMDRIRTDADLYTPCLLYRHHMSTATLAEW